MPLDPDNLTPAASLNRLRLVDPAVVAMEPDTHGRTGHDLLSLEAFAMLLRETAALGLPGDGDAAALARAFDRCFVSDDPAIRRAAEGVAARFGRRLGCLLLTLARGDAASRQVRPDWDDADWARWTGVETFWIGGGLASGHLGPRLVDHATATLRAAGLTSRQARLAAHPALLPLIGAARGLPPGHDAALVVDFGQTAVKRVLAVYRDGALAALRLPPPRPARHTAPHAIDPDQARRLGHSMAASLAGAWRDLDGRGGRPAPIIVVSLAAYLHDGQPLPRQGSAYAALRLLSDNLADWLSRRVSAVLARPVQVVLLHDGSAAARSYAGTARAVVITLGTALGVGFPPGLERLRPLAPAIEIVEGPW